MTDGTEHRMLDDASIVDCAPLGENSRRESFSISASEWNRIQSQNLLILEKLSKIESKQSGRKRQRESDDGDSDVEPLCALTQSQKRTLPVPNDSMDVEQQIDDLLNETNIDSDNTCDAQDAELARIQEEYAPEELVGKPIRDQLATIVDTMSQGKLAEEKLREKFAQHRRPENTKITVPRVNPEVWGLLDHGSRAADVKKQKTQRLLTTATYALSRVADTCAASTVPETRGILKDVMDAVGLILKANHDLSMERRTKVMEAPQINRKYRKLATTETPVSDLLFGDDLKASCASIDSSSKLGLSFSQSSRGNKFFPRRFSQTPVPKNWEEARRGRGSASNRARGQQRGRYPRSQGRHSYYKRWPADQM